jgi:two-component system response regulator YesN
MKVLVADDDKFIRNRLEDIFLQIGCLVKTVESGSEVIREVLNKKYAAIFLDLHINGIEGVELIEAVRQIDSGLPIVILTGDESPDMKKNVMQHGVSDYLLKPIRKEILEKIINKKIRMNENGES